MRVLQLGMAHGLSVHVAGAKLASRDRSGAAEVAVVHRQVHVGKSRAGMQRRKATAVVIAEPDLTEAPAAPSAPPGMEMVARSERQPADSAPAETEAKAETKPPAEAEERNIGRRPDGTIERISVDWTRPPTPTAIDIHPAAVVIRRPAPVIVGNPGPSPIRFVHPASIAIRSPARRHGWPPHRSVIRNLGPGAMAIEIFGAGVIGTGLAPGFGIADQVVAIGVPLVKVIARRRFADLVLRIGARTLNGNELVLPDMRAALRRGHFDFAFTHQNFGVIVGGHQNAKARF